MGMREWYWSSRSQRSGQTAGESPPGCMSGVLQLFDLHQLLFTTPTRSAELFPEDHHHPELLKVPGVEAPRNSLELNEATASSGSAIALEQQEYDIPIGIRLVPRKKTVGDEEERGSLQGTGTRTGNVVARLMGLDQLPDTASSPHMINCRQNPLISPPPIRSQPQISKKKRYTDTCPRETPLTPPPRVPLQARSCNTPAGPPDVSYGTRASRSLPETPRVSSARISWDSDPRLSLQASNKENYHVTSTAFKRLNCFCEVPGDCSLSPSPKSRKDWKLPLEENKSPGHYAREIVKQVKDSVSRRIGGGNEKKAGREQLNRSKASTPIPKFEGSPKSKYFSQDLMPSPPCLGSPSIPSKARDLVKTKKSGSERFTERLKKPPPAAVRREVFASTPLRSPTSVPTKRIESPTKTAVLPVPTTQPTSCRSENRARSNGGASPGPDELLYVKCILERAGVVHGHVTTCCSPVDPALFHQLELSYSSARGALRLRSNRKLLFHLVDEILGDFFLPDHHRAACRRWNTTDDSRRALDGEDVLRQLWSRIQSFPSADCHVIQDIDALVEGDLSSTNVRRLLLHPTVLEEADSVVLEVERLILDSLVGDAAAALVTSRNRVPYGNGAACNDDDWRSIRADLTWAFT